MNIPLVTLIEQKAGIRLSKKSNHFKFGSEFWGMCPFCRAGDDRFHVWQGGERDHYWCRVCGKEGSPIQFLVDYCAMSYSDAYRELGIERDGFAPTPARTPDAHQPPCKEWQESALLLIERAEKFLWHPKSPEGRRALIYLWERGLTDETIKRARIGFVPLAQDGRWYKEPFTWWGFDLDTLTDADKEKGGIRIPNGILIPWFEGDVVWKLAMKRPGEQMDYGQIQGSAKGLYGIDNLQPGKPCMIVESELCALSVQQEAGDLISCVATGGVNHGKDGRWPSKLSTRPIVLQSFDADSKGDAGATAWLDLIPHALRWQPWAAYERNGELWFKDPNDCLRYADEFQEWTGMTLRGWVEAGLWAARLEPPPDPTPLQGSDAPIVPSPVQMPDYQRIMDTQEQFERLCISERVTTPEGPGQIWDMLQLRIHIERGAVRVTLDKLKGSRNGATKLFVPQDIEPVLSAVHLAF